MIYSLIWICHKFISVFATRIFNAVLSSSKLNICCICSDCSFFCIWAQTVFSKMIILPTFKTSNPISESKVFLTNRIVFVARDKLSTDSSCLYQALKKIFSKQFCIHMKCIRKFLSKCFCLWYNFEFPIFTRLVLLSCVWQMFSHWYLLISLLADVIAIYWVVDIYSLCSFVADVIGHYGRWNCQLNIDCSFWWLMLLPYDSVVDVDH